MQMSLWEWTRGELLKQAIIRNLFRTILMEFMLSWSSINKMIKLKTKLSTKMKSSSKNLKKSKKLKSLRKDKFLMKKI